ncbi:MAG: cobalt ABC transporter ATP-binding protein [Chloroflexota bacterium]
MRLRAEGLRLRYPGRSDLALDGVNLDVGASELVAIAGRNGAGKSSLALAAAGLIPRVVRAAVRGAVWIDGVAAFGASAAELAGRVGIVFSTPANQLSGSKPSVREELAFGLENLGVPRAEMDGRIERVLERLGIGHLAEREPSTLSGGEQQRVAIARALATRNPLLLADEPTGELDYRTGRQILSLLQAQVEEGATVVIVTHNREIARAAGRVIELSAGRVVSDGPRRAGRLRSRRSGGSSLGCALPPLVGPRAQDPSAAGGGGGSGDRSRLGLLLGPA